MADDTQQNFGLRERSLPTEVGLYFSGDVNLAQKTLETCHMQVFCVYREVNADP